MMNRLVKAVALICPTGRVTSIQNNNTQSTITVLKKLQLKLDQALKQQYIRISQDFLNKKINSDETVSNSRFSL